MFIENVALTSDEKAKEVDFFISKKNNVESTLYPTKNIIQRTVLNLFQQQVQLKKLNLKYNSRSKNTIHLVGDFFLGNSNQHKLIEFLQQIKSIPIKDVLSTFTSSSRLLVPPIKK